MTTIDIVYLAGFALCVVISPVVFRALIEAGYFSLMKPTDGSDYAMTALIYSVVWPITLPGSFLIWYVFVLFHKNSKPKEGKADHARP
jgi:hypothetical protein